MPSQGKTMSKKNTGDKDGADVDAYLASVPNEFRTALQELRKTIHSAVPQAEEGFSYGVPAFKLDGKPLACYAAFKNHCGFYPMSPAIIKEYSKDLAEFETAKGTVRFSPEKSLPTELVKKMVRARLREIQEK